MRYNPFDYDWTWDWQTIGEDEVAKASIFFMPREGHAYSVCQCPKYLDKNDWMAIASRITACVNACNKMSDPSIIHEIVSALQGLTAIYTDMLQDLNLDESPNHPYNKAKKVLKKLYGEE